MWFRDTEQDEDLKRITFVFLLVIIVGTAGLLLQNTDHDKGWQDFLKTAGATILVAGACLVAGAITGFLFGVPRVRPSPTVNGDEEVKPAIPVVTGKPGYRANTNLEQISDWLTKIIVGISLVQLRSVPGYSRQLAAYFAAVLGPGGSGQPVALALIVYFFTSGFLAGYLVTRLYLLRAFERSEQAPITTALPTKFQQDSVSESD